MASSSGGTLRDVAEAAGVSPSTASRVLNGGKPVSAALAERVRVAARRVGYSPNRLAQALRGRTGTVSVIVDDPTTPSIAATVTAMQAEAASTGAVVTVAASGADRRRQLESVRTLVALRPRAIVLTGAWMYDDRLAEDLREDLTGYESRGGRVVIIGKSHLGWPRIDYDDRQLGVRMAEHVAGLGRTLVLVLAGPASHPSLADRARGFREGLMAGGVPAGDIHTVHSPIHREGGAAATAEAWDRIRPDTIMAANDLLALGALAELSRRGVDVPREVVLTGIDDIPIARDVDPALTTMALPFDAVGRMALRRALDARPVGATVGGRLVVRASTGG